MSGLFPRGVCPWSDSDSDTWDHRSRGREILRETVRWLQRLVDPASSLTVSRPLLTCRPSEDTRRPLDFRPGTPPPVNPTYLLSLHRPGRQRSWGFKDPVSTADHPRQSVRGPFRRGPSRLRSAKSKILTGPTLRPTPVCPSRLVFVKTD